jgi:hypothetical protein
MNQKGMISLDYLVALVLVGGFSLLIFALSFSLSMVEVVQYMTFASARTFYAGNMDPNTQIQAGNKKFMALVNDRTFKPLFKNGWFTLDLPATVGSIKTSSKAELSQYKNQPDDLNLFHGTAVGLTLNVLDIKVPFFGATSTGGQNGKQKEFSAIVGSYLGRETSFQECENFMIDRFKAIQSLQNKEGAAPYSQVKSVYVYIPSDNGC